MLTESLDALAAAGGTAVVQAAGADAWEGFRERVARLFGRGDRQREHRELALLDQTSALLAAAADPELQRVRDQQESFWRARFGELLECTEPGSKQLAEDLQVLLRDYAEPRGIAPGGLTAGRDILISSDNGSIAAGVIQGGAHIAVPHKPDPSRG